MPGPTAQGLAALVAAVLLAGAGGSAEEIGEVTTAIKILGANHRIVVEAFDDPKVEGVACFVSRARTGGISGSLGLAEDTSDASIDCQQTGPVKFRAELEDGEEVFSRRASVLFKRVQVVRFFDEAPQRAGLSHLFRPADRGLAEEQHLGGRDPRWHGAHPLSRGRPVLVGAAWPPLAAPAAAEEIGEVTTAIRILGANHRIVIEAFDDPKVEGVACFVSRARTGGISGSLGLAEDTSDASIECQQTGPVKFRDELEDGEEVFSRRASILFKHIQVVRFFDRSRNALVYLTYSDKLIEGSPKNSISAVVIRDTGSERDPLSRRGPGDAGRRRAGRSAASSPRRWRWRPRRWRRTAAATCALPGGRGFRAVIGDMDSLARRGRGCAPRACRCTAIAEQDIDRPREVPLLGRGAALHRARLPRRADRPPPRGDERAGEAPGEAGRAGRRRRALLSLPADARARACARHAGFALPDGAGARRALRGAALAGRRAGVRPGRADRHLERGARRAGRGSASTRPGCW